MVWLTAPYTALIAFWIYNPWHSPQIRLRRQTYNGPGAISQGRDLYQRIARLQKIGSLPGNWLTKPLTSGLYPGSVTFQRYLGVYTWRQREWESCLGVAGTTSCKTPFICSSIIEFAGRHQIESGRLFVPRGLPCQKSHKWQLQPNLHRGNFCCRLLLPVAIDWKLDIMVNNGGKHKLHSLISRTSDFGIWYIRSWCGSQWPPRSSYISYRVQYVFLRRQLDHSWCSWESGYAKYYTPE